MTTINRFSGYYRPQFGEQEEAKETERERILREIGNLEQAILVWTSDDADMKARKAQMLRELREELVNLPK